MSAAAPERLLACAAAGSFERIDRDRLGASSVPSRVFEHLRQHLFDPSLNASTLFYACGIRDHGVRSRFREETGLTPYAYIETLRLETASKLLAETDLRIWQVAELVGYSELAVFSRAFLRRFASRPTAYRRRQRKARRSEPQPATTAAPGNGSRPRRKRKIERAREVDVATLRRALEGGLDHDRAEDVLRHLLNLYPAAAVSAAQPVETIPAVAPRVEDHEAPTTPAVVSHTAAELGLDRRRIEELKAQEIWDSIADKPRQEQRATVRTVPFHTPALFELLCVKSREVGREDRRKGIPVAHLALDSIAGIQGLTGAARANLRARGWAFVGNARRLRLDFSEAEKALAKAERMLPELARDALAEGEVLLARSSLCASRGDYDAAIKYADTAITSFRRGTNSEQLSTAILVRARTRLTKGETREVLDDLREGYTLAESCGSQYLAAVALQGLIHCQLALGEYAAAHEWLLELKTREAQGAVAPHLHTLWLEGLLSAANDELEAACEKLSASHSGFLKALELDRAAIVLLDLAEVKLRMAKPIEALELCAASAKVLSRLKTNSYFIALGVLQRALEAGTLSPSRLRQARLAVASASGNAPPIPGQHAHNDL